MVLEHNGTAFGGSAEFDGSLNSWNLNLSTRCDGVSLGHILEILFTFVNLKKTVTIYFLSYRLFLTSKDIVFI